MEYVVIPIVSFGASLLTFYSGFGLGTLLMPVMAIFFPLDAAVAVTAVVHFLNNLFKLVLVGRKADAGIIRRFGIPAVLSALVGAWLLLRMQNLAPLFSYSIGSRACFVTTLKIAMAVIIMGFVILEERPFFTKLAIDPRWLPVGGVLSGFFGGLSGHQGALRSAFLVKCGLGKESFIATGIVIACLVDFSRLGVYATHRPEADWGKQGGVLALAVIAAFSGAWFGNRILKKVTMGAVQRIVSLLLFAVAVALGAGLI